MYEDYSARYRKALINCTKLCKCSLGSLEVHFSVRNEGLAVITCGCCDRCTVSYECSTCGNAIDDACKFVRRVPDFKRFFSK